MTHWVRIISTLQLTTRRHGGALICYTNLALAALSLQACEDKKAAAPDSAPAPVVGGTTASQGSPAETTKMDPRLGTVAEANAKALFAQRCVLCHGSDGKGNGAAAANLNPKPRNYTDAAWQASVTDDDLSKIIVEGGAAVGKSMMMPPNPDLKDKPETVKELVKIVRSFGKK